ncbi:MAG TPA: RNA 2',3'-cyclic phosphodiesterase [Bacteroidota bacterium]|jgi:2'-5' RNA ligase
MGSIRTFIAFDTPSPVRDAMIALQEALAEADADVRWESPEKSHTTVKFLGAVDESILPGVLAATGSACREFRPFEVTYEGIGAFPDRRHPKVIWIGCRNDDGSLASLKSSLDRALASFGFPIEDRPFRPHITLGRVRGPRGLRNLTPKLEKLTFEPRKETISEILVMKSVLRPQGGEYSALTSLHLHS